MQTADHLDLVMLAELKDVMEDDYPLLVETFINDSIIRIESLDKAVESGVAESLRVSAHSFKGSASNMGAIALSRLCKQLEDMGYEGDISEADPIIDQVKREYRSVVTCLSKI
ncbi:HPt (histidine-containing phosphotransfer) domain-containing protein [Sinobacterium caligoides]|uniref:HPt (Histidine-containing phosphotransfer) domain-containing protein n=1 Tax=Sinobacterium caligoides TaxID=933926 RepID=A0A3N2DY16_9GAMM|nr:Hpt domain-containing protein [Sinobacterium caligoides]ROS04677.1 HPt (histidine-containing phosphotransfer) domain-containing protein [Sinobacterium caligoides]